MNELDKWRDGQKISGRSYKADARVWRAALKWADTVIRRNYLKEKIGVSECKQYVDTYQLDSISDIKQELDSIKEEVRSGRLDKLLSDMYDLIAAVHCANQHTDGSYESKNLDIESLITQLHNQWVFIMCELDNRVRRDMDTIEIDKFRNLVGGDSPCRVPNSRKLCGKFGISMKTQKKQCENLKVGDTVFFLEAVYKGLGADNRPEVQITVKQAKVVENTVSFEGTKLPVRNELEN